MSKSILAAAIAAASIGFAGSAFAADLARAPAPSAQAYPQTVTDYAFNWSGPYVGANLGYRWVGVDVSNAGTDGSFNLDSNSVFGGLQAGYNWQIGHFVYGIETDFGYGGGSKSFAGDGDYSAKMTWDGTTRARAGFAFDRFLAYGTAGVAYGDFKTNSDGSSKSDWHAGWTAGAGLEYAITNNVTVKGEYLYADYGNIKNDGVKYDFTNNLVRIGVNYKF